MATGLLDSSYDVRRVYQMGDFTLSRFLPSFQLKRENHIGELITDRRGRTAYLKTFRLAENQIRRGYLLTRLAAAQRAPGRVRLTLAGTPERKPEPSNGSSNRTGTTK